MFKGKIANCEATTIAELGRRGAKDKWHPFHACTSPTPRKNWGKLFYLQLQLFYLQLSFFAYSPLRCFLDMLSHCKQRSSHVSKNRSNCKQNSSNCKQKRSQTQFEAKKLSCKQEAFNCKQKSSQTEIYPVQNWSLKMH